MKKLLLALAFLLLLLPLSAEAATHYVAKAGSAWDYAADTAV